MEKIVTNRPFPNYLRPHFGSESWCSSFHMQINFHSYENEFNLRVNESYLHMKGLAPRLASKKRPEIIRKWPITNDKLETM